jgi:hypothetical protein
MVVKVGFVRHPGKSIGKFSQNITGAAGQGIDDIFVHPIQELTGTASSFVNSPIWYIALAGGGLILLTAVVKSSSTANTALENPESLKILAQAATQAR